MSEVLETFYVVGESGYVLTVTEKDSVTLSTRIGTKRQLWKWNGNTLISVYSNMALAVNSESFVITSVLNDDVNQKWRHDDNCIIHEKTSLKLSTKKKDKEGVQEGCSIVVSAQNENEEQLWAIEPRLGKVDMDDLLSREPTEVNPVAVFCYWKSILQDELKDHIGCNISEYKEKIEEAVGQMRECADTLDSVISNTGIARATGGGLGIAGGIAGLVGLGLAPFTAGISLVLTVGGAVTAAAGGVTSLTGTLVNMGWEKGQTAKAKEVTNDVARFTQSLQELLAVYLKRLSEAGDFLDNNKEYLIEDESNLETFFETGQILTKGAKVGYKVVKAGSKLYKGVKGYKELMNIIKVIRPDILAIQGAKSGLAASAAAPKVSILFGRGTIAAAGTLGAKVFAGVFGIVGIGFGIWETIDAASDISNGSKIAEEFRNVAKNLEKVGNEVLENYEKFVCLK